MLYVEPRRFPSRESYATWLFEFLRVDFATMPAGQAQDWQREAKAFVDLGEGVIIDLSRSGGLQTPEQLPTIALLRSMQQQLRTGLETLWRGKDDWVRPPIKKRVARGGRLLLEHRQGSFRHLFVNAMQQMVIESWARIRTCPRCGNPFLKVRKQQYLLAKLFPENPVSTVRWQATARLSTRIRAGREEEAWYHYPSEARPSSTPSWFPTGMRPRVGLYNARFNVVLRPRPRDRARPAPTVRRGWRASRG